MSVITSFLILYDADCGICTRVKDWMRQQERLIDLDFLPTGSPEAGRRFSQVHAGELTVVANTGEVWLGNHAWIVCLWALKGYRDLAFRLTGPLLSLMVREAFEVVSRNRSALSIMQRLRSARELEQELKKVIVPKCHQEQT